MNAKKTKIGKHIDSWIKTGANKPNVTAIAIKKFQLEKFQKAEIAVTADSFYRLFVNGVWISDGPVHAWAECYSYDILDITKHLRPGINEIKILTRYDGVGSFRHIPQAPALAAKLYVDGVSVLKTDESWEIANCAELYPIAPRDSIQQGFFESYDAGEEEKLEFSNAVRLSESEIKWHNLSPSTVAPLTRLEKKLKSFTKAHIVGRASDFYAVPVTNLLYPGLIEANCSISRAAAFATVALAEKSHELKLDSDICEVCVNGELVKNGVCRVRKGRNLIIFVVKRCFEYSRDAVIEIGKNDLNFINPLNGNDVNHWVFLKFEDLLYAGDDMIWHWFDNPGQVEVEEKIEANRKFILRNVHDEESFWKYLVGKAQIIPDEEILIPDPHSEFVNREILTEGKTEIDTVDDSGALSVFPSDSGDLELIYDLGEQNCGYYKFEIEADAGTIIDIFAVEYISEDGRIQHTIAKRNGMRYVCKVGLNEYTSLKRRSGRYIFLTIKKFSKPVRIKSFSFIESTYPVPATKGFESDNESFNKLWDISKRSLKLCMEDTYTDCPCYEQVLWVGDARYEAQYGYYAFGANDIGQYSAKLAAQSLEDLPMVGCQVPSAWRCLIPAWSFMWGLSVWDNYFYSGDEKFLREIFPYVMKNLEGAESFIDEKTGLFKAKAWNMFDWCGMDHEHEIVLHNTMFFIGAIDAAAKCAEILGEGKTIKYYLSLKKSLKDKVNSYWDEEKKAYPDSIHEDGTISETFSEHTSFLALLFNIIAEDKQEDAISNILNSEKKLVRVGSPIAVPYLFEALEKIGAYNELIDSCMSLYEEMLSMDSSTVWETFRGSFDWVGDFPTRSYCHGASAAPMYFFNRVILGVRQEGAGGTRVSISPWVNYCNYASGEIKTINGSIYISWEKMGKSLIINLTAPENVDCYLIENASHRNFNLISSVPKVSL